MTSTNFLISHEGLSQLNLPQIGAMAIAVASIDDLAAWCLRAIAVALTKSHDVFSVLPTIGSLMAFAGIMATAGQRPPFEPDLASLAGWMHN